MNILEEQADYLLGGTGILEEDILEESINDKNLFKAVFMAGGPGSGKGFISDRLFKGTGAKVVNSDTPFEFLLVKNNLPKKINPNDVEMYKKQMELRANAKSKAKSQEAMWVDGMLPLILDGTGKNYDNIKKHREMLQNMGYDTSMVFVNTTLDVAQERNKKRARSVPDEVVKKGWEQVQSNIGKFQNLFGSNMIVVDNSSTLDDAGIKKLNITLARKSMKILNAPLKNRLGQSTISFLKKIGGKYISDINSALNKTAA